MTEQTSNNALLLAMPDSPVNIEPPAELYRLLAERIARYTMGDSTSIPADTARLLLESILYCLDLNRRFPVADVPQEAPLKTRWEAGVHQAKRIAARAKLLLRQAQRTPPPLVNTAYCDTLESLPAFFVGYDPDFFAQEIPCSFDYPLCLPVSESLLGAEFILEYLRKLLAENTILRAFPSEALRALYERYYIDYVDLLVNLCLPAAEMATLCALANQPGQPLSLTKEALSWGNKQLAEESEAEARAAIESAATRALEELHLRGAYPAELMRRTALDLVTRVRAALTGLQTDKKTSGETGSSPILDIT